MSRPLADEADVLALRPPRGDGNAPCIFTRARAERGETPTKC
jgi:hypothetical protein